MNQQTSRFIIRPMISPELSIAVDWAAAEGWNPGLHDQDCFFAADTGGFLLGLLNNKPAGCVSAVKYGEDYGFIGFYIVSPEYRGQGLGIQLWDAALKRLGGRTVGLDGVLAQQANYQKSGFTLAYRNIRYEDAERRFSRPDRDMIPLHGLPFDQIAAYDRSIFGFPRASFLQAWLNQPASAALGFMQEGRLAGYGVIRACREGNKIGPLFADDAGIAARLYDALAASVPGGSVYLDVPEINAAAVDFLARRNMRKVFETARMYLRPGPPLPVHKVFGVTTFELG